MVENYVYTFMLTICNCIYELLSTGSTTTSWPDHLFTWGQINTRSLFHRPLTSAHTHHCYSTVCAVGLLFVQTAFNFLLLCSAPLNVEIGDEKEKQGEDPQCAGIETRVHPDQAISRSEIEYGDLMKTVSSLGSGGSLQTSSNFFLPSLLCLLVFLPLIFGH